MDERLFTVENPDGQEGDFTQYINPNSLSVITNAKAEPFLKNAKDGDKFQFLRLGYFSCDQNSSAEKIIFNRTVTLKDEWAKEKKK